MRKLVNTVTMVMVSMLIVNKMTSQYPTQMAGPGGGRGRWW